MADKITDIKYEPGDPVDTSSAKPVCPNGHPLSTHVTRRKGQGRSVCPQCGWNDAQAVMGATGVQVATQPQIVGAGPQTASLGVTVISQRGVENRRPPNVLSR
jgi:hypothetical protein